MKKFTRKCWTKEEDLFLINNIRELSLKELAKSLNRTVASIADRTQRTLKINRPSVETKMPKTGERFGNLTVVSIFSLKDYLVLCKCDCSGESITSIYRLRNGDTSTCGCGLYGIVRRYDKGGITIKWMYRTYEQNALKQNRNFFLTLEEFKEITSLDCFYCYFKPKFMNRYLDSNGKQVNKNKEYQIGTIKYACAYMNGIDRVDNKIGYKLTNCVPCCSDCNFAKGSMTIYEWLSYIERFKLGFTREMLAKIEKSNILMPPKDFP